MALANDSSAFATPRAGVPARLYCAAATLSVILFSCVAGPYLGSLPEPVGGNVLASGQPMLSPGHVLGTDLNGNDVLSRLLHGGRLSFLIALTANVLGLAVGSLIGMFSGYVGGHLDSILMRLLDAFVAFPTLVLAMVIASTMGSSHVELALALMFFTLPAFSRIARGSTLRIRDQPFILAAKLSGASVFRVVLLHVTPNILPQLTTFLFLSMGTTIVVEGALSYLGLGMRPPIPSWGSMIFHGQQALSAQPSLVLLPCLCLFATVLSCNLLADDLRERWST